MKLGTLPILAAGVLAAATPVVAKKQMPTDLVKSCDALTDELEHFQTVIHTANPNLNRDLLELNSASEKVEKARETFKTNYKDSSDSLRLMVSEANKQEGQRYHPYDELQDCMRHNFELTQATTDSLNKKLGNKKLAEVVSKPPKPQPSRRAEL